VGERATAVVKAPEAKPVKSSPQKRQPEICASPASPCDQIALLHRSIGNRAVVQLYRSGLLQAKLKIGEPNDIYEQEADRVAERIMRMQEPTVQPKPT
jgi:hypothetical protein